ncbi:hypothetical protein HK104_002649 [Borealophlyctis nickersoniae]|nr:hypothetical protein HK104_002649 [Borealophlyctis nickersoniae]
MRRFKAKEPAFSSVVVIIIALESRSTLGPIATPRSHLIPRPNKNPPIHQYHPYFPPLPPAKIAKLDYLFGASGESAVGKRKLRVRIGPSLDKLAVAKVNDEENPHFIDSPYFTGHICVKVKNFRGITPDGSKPIETVPYFGSKKRLFAIQFSGRFKHEYTAEDVLFGAEFQKKVSPPMGSSLALKFANLIDPALKSEIYSDTPWLYSPMLCSMNIVNVEKAKGPVVNAHPSESVDPSPTKSSSSGGSSPGVTVMGPDPKIPKDPKLEVSQPSKSVTTKPSPAELLTEWRWVGNDELQEDTNLMLDEIGEDVFPPDGIAERRKYFQKQKARQSFVFKPDYVYNFEIFAPFIDLNTFDLSLGISINLIQYLKGQPIRMMAKSWSKNVPFFVIEFDLIEDKAEETESEESVEDEDA